MERKWIYVMWGLSRDSPREKERMVKCMMI